VRRRRAAHRRRRPGQAEHAQQRDKPEEEDGRGEDVDRGLADHGDEFVEPPGPDGVDDEGEEERE